MRISRGQLGLRLAAPPCPSCGSTSIPNTAASGGYFCYRCKRTFGEIELVPFDDVVDAWTPHLAALQAAGDAVIVRLPAGFYGVCLIRAESLMASILREMRRQGHACARE